MAFKVGISTDLSKICAELESNITQWFNNGKPVNWDIDGITITFDLVFAIKIVSGIDQKDPELLFNIQKLLMTLDIISFSIRLMFMCDLRKNDLKHLDYYKTCLKVLVEKQIEITKFM